MKKLQLIMVAELDLIFNNITDIIADPGFTERDRKKILREFLHKLKLREQNKVGQFGKISRLLNKGTVCAL